MGSVTVWQGAEIPAPTPELTKSLPPQERIEHRQEIAFEVKTVLSAYFQPHEDDEVKASQLAWWCDELEDWTREQVVYGLRQWNAKNPRLRPTPGDITALLKQIRGERMAERQKSAHKPQEPERTQMTEAEKKERAERAQRIMGEVFGAGDKDGENE